MNANRLFLASRFALIVTAMSFAIRAGAVGAWGAQFHLTHEEVGQVIAPALWGFTVAMIFGGPLCDLVGLGRIVGFAFVGHLAGILLTIFAWNFWSLFAANLIFGIANGSVEAACNPLITTLFPDDKTTKLNHFHVWFPGGIVIGGVLAYFMEKAGFGWKAEFATMLLPLAIYGIIFLGQTFPKTERVQRGVSTGSMWAACFHPLFLVMVACMVMTATTELGTNTWITNILTAASIPGILVLAWINGVMAVGRQCAGTFVHRISPIGMLIMSSILSREHAVCGRDGIRLGRLLFLANHARVHERAVPQHRRAWPGDHGRRGHARRRLLRPDHREAVRHGDHPPDAGGPDAGCAGGGGAGQRPRHPVDEHSGRGRP